MYPPFPFKSPGSASAPMDFSALYLGLVELLLRLGVGRTEFHVGNLAYHRKPRGLHLRRADAESLPQGVLIGPIVLRQLTIHNGNQLGLGCVPFSEKAAPQQRNIHRLEIVPENYRRSRQVHCGALWRNIPIYHERLAGIRP